jgi:hypothetical protein
MSENIDQEIELKEGETKEIEIDIPLAVPGDDRPEVPEEEEQDNQSTEGQDQNLENDDQNEESGLSDVGQMNQRPEMRNVNNNSGKQNGAEGDQEQDSKQNGDEKSSKDGRKDSQAEKQDKDRKNIKKNAEDKSNSGMKNLSSRDKAAEASGRLGDKLLSNSGISEDNRNKKDRKKDRSRVTDQDYNDPDHPEIPTDKQNFMSSWNRLRNSVRNKDDQSDVDQKRSATGVVINRGSRLLSFEFYRLCWLNLIDSIGLTYFGLLFLFVAKYVAHSNKIVKFVSIKNESVRLEIIEHREKTEIKMIILFIVLSIVVMIVLGIVVVLIYFMIRVQNLTLWGLLKDPAQFKEDWNLLYNAFKALI